MLALGILGLGAVGVAIAGAVVGTYLFLRNNKKKKAIIDSFANKVGDKFGK